MAQVEDVAGTAGVGGQHLVHLGLDDRPRARHTAGSRLPCTPTGRAPAAASIRCRAASSGVLQSTPTTSGPAAAIRPSSSPVSTPKWIVGTSRSASAGEHPPAVGEHVALVVRRGERAGPGVEQLHGLGAARDLAAQRGHGQVGQAVEQSVPERLVAEHQGLGQRVGAGRPALDQVAGHGERRAGEADERDGQLLGQQADRLEDVRGVLLGLERPEAVEVGGPPERLGDDRSGAGGDVDAEADGVGRDHDVAVEDGGVDAVAAHRLERDLRRQLGPLDGVEDAALAPDGAVLGQRPPGLAHEPHRCPRGGTAGAGGQEGGVGRGGHPPCTLRRGRRGGKRRRWRLGWHVPPWGITAKFLTEPLTHSGASTEPA